MNSGLHGYYWSKQCGPCSQATLNDWDVSFTLFGLHPRWTGPPLPHPHINVFQSSRVSDAVAKVERSPHALRSPLPWLMFQSAEATGHSPITCRTSSRGNESHCSIKPSRGTEKKEKWMSQKLDTSIWGSCRLANQQGLSSQWVVIGMHEAIWDLMLNESIYPSTLALV